MNIAWSGIIIESLVFILLAIVTIIAINLYTKKINKIDIDMKNQDKSNKES